MGWYFARTANSLGTGEEGKQRRCYRPIQGTSKKNHQLTAYEAWSYSDGYKSDFTANTKNSEGTSVFEADTEFDANTSVNSNEEIEGNLPSDLTVTLLPSWKVSYRTSNHPGVLYQDLLKWVLIFLISAKFLSMGTVKKVFTSRIHSETHYFVERTLVDQKKESNNLKI